MRKSTELIVRGLFVAVIAFGVGVTAAAMISTGGF